MKPSLRQGYLLIIFCLFIVGFFYVRFRVLPDQQSQQQQREQLYQQALERVAAFAGTKEDDRPARTIVDDVATLKAANPEFYAEARSGDWVLRYQKIVVLYRSQTNEVIKIQEIKETP